MSYLKKLLIKFITYSLFLSIVIFMFGVLLGYFPGLDVYLLYISIFAVIYLPLSFINFAWPKKKKGQYEDPEILKDNRVMVANDLAHFRELAQKALKGNAVAQREVEMRLLLMADVNLKIRYGISDKELTTRLDDGEFLSRYMGHAGNTLAKLYKRRHDLSISTPPEEFKKEVEEVLEAMK